MDALEYRAKGTVLCPSSQSAKADHDPIVVALEAACFQLGIRRPVALLIHPEKTIPMVWGVFRCRLLLPAAARHWGGEQLRSALLHELAHVKRRDMMGQLLAQIACALHWYNPLVWFAAWRLGVERERACDDLVLASGVRPSAYAGHLLDVVTRLRPLAGRGRAVWSWPENHRWKAASSPCSARTATVAGCRRRWRQSPWQSTVGVAVPFAMLRAADEKPGEETETGDHRNKAKRRREARPQHGGETAVGRTGVGCGRRLPSALLPAS